MTKIIQLYQLPIEVRDKAQTVVDKSSIISNFFRDLGYRSVVTRHEMDSILHLPQTNLIYTNNEREVRITMLYYDAFDNQVSRLSISITIVPRDTPGGYLSFKEYLEKLDVHLSEGELDAIHYPGNYEEQITAVFSRVKELLQEYALGLLNGEEWRSDCFPNW
jgi:hypothetical protein